MHTKKTISNIIDLSYNQFIRCWNIMEKAKSYPGSSSLGEEILQFQPILCEAIYELENIYRSISREKKYRQVHLTEF